MQRISGIRRRCTTREDGVLGTVRAPCPADELVARRAVRRRNDYAPCSVSRKAQDPTGGARCVGDHEVDHLVGRQGCGADHVAHNDTWRIDAFVRSLGQCGDTGTHKQGDAQYDERTCSFHEVFSLSLILVSPVVGAPNDTTAVKLACTPALSAPGIRSRRLRSV
jgi:hypothetical protein